MFEAAHPRWVNNQAARVLNHRRRADGADLVGASHFITEEDTRRDGLRQL